MGRTEPIKRRVSGTASRIQPAFVLVGAPGTNKQKIADELARDYFTEKLAVAGKVFPAHYALGLLADYRAENMLMSQRATVLHSVEMPVLYTHSLIDSLTYSLLRVDNQQRHQNVSAKMAETWALTMGMAGVMLRDTYKADETFFLMADFDPEESYESFKIQETLGFVLDGYEINYQIIDANTETAIDDIADTIRSYIR